MSLCSWVLGCGLRAIVKHLLGGGCSFGHLGKERRKRLDIEPDALYI